MFQINDKVLCVDDRFDRPSVLGRERPVKGTIYTVNGIAPDLGMYSTVAGMPDDGYVVYVVGLQGGWNTARFRKLSDIKNENAAKRAGVRNA